MKVYFYIFFILKKQDFNKTAISVENESGIFQLSNLQICWTMIQNRKIH